MADLVVGMARSVVDGALTKAQAAMEEDAKLRKSAARNLVFITGEFQMMKSFLEIADSERLKNPVVRTWVFQIRDLAYDVEDCIEFVVHLDKKNHWWLRMLKPASWLLGPCVDLSGPLLLDMAVDELEHLKARVEDVSNRNARYSLINSDSGFKPPAADVMDQLSASRDTVRTKSVISFLEAENTNPEGLEITQFLPGKDHDLGVISIWGTGGGDVGMASIAWSAYTDEKTCRNFVCRAWVKLMHPFEPQEFIRSVTAQFCANSSSLVKEDATRGGDLLVDFEQLLMKNRYLVVLEDLSTVAEWAAIRRFFPNEKNGSCIILSTQQFEVASLSVGRPYQVLHLNQLFSTKHHKQLQAEHSVYAVFTKGSQYHGEKGMDINSAVSIGKSKTEAAESWIKNNRLVGRTSELKDLSLKVAMARARSYQVMSVWGFTGVGKSALVKTMYCEKIITAKLFQRYGWVDVSHPFSLRDFSRTLLSNFGSQYLQDSEPAYLYSMGSSNPIAGCRQILEKHRCLVVIDGLQYREDWDLIKAELVSGSHRQNVVIVVTTEQEIATHCRGDKGEFVFSIKGLAADTAVELFGTKVNFS